MTATYETHAAAQGRRERVLNQCDLAGRALMRLHQYAENIPFALQLVPPELRGGLATQLADELLRMHTAAQQALLAVASAVGEVGRDAG